MRKKKIKFRPWVKIAGLFILGVVITANIFSIFDASASETSSKGKVLHGVVSMNLNGDTVISTLEEHTDGGLIIKNKYYPPMEIVTVIIENETVVNSYLTKGKELKEIEKNEEWSIITIRRNVVDALYE